ncbi:MAG: hypothetical protein DME23_18155 [Verrucomicrobia bacterium]|nr:MAG: hypothetical protein DME23_18155 [Verrucomicrobiota bacterium]
MVRTTEVAWACNCQFEAKRNVANATPKEVARPIFIAFSKLADNLATLVAPVKLVASPVPRLPLMRLAECRA